MDERHGPPWAGGPGWGGPGFRAGRRFRRGGLVVLLFVVLLVAVLATLVASLLSGNAPSPGVTVTVTFLVIVGLLLSARVVWRTTRTVGSLLDATDRVASGDYDVRVEDAPARQLRRLTTGFNQMAERLQTNEMRRRELLADIAHELRNPLQVIHGSVEGMLDGLYPTDAEHLRLVLDGTIVMTRLLDDLRTLSMAEAGVLALHPETVDPVAVAEEIGRSYRASASAAGVSLVVEASPDAPRSIEADPVRLAEMLSNLLTNAVRHTPTGGSVTVRVSRGAGARFEVEDTGPGIPADQLATVFDRFVTSADTGGTGLGLAIAKRLVEAQGGQIEALRAQTGGTIIRFEIPV